MINLQKLSRKKMKIQNISENLSTDLFLDEDDLPSMPPLEDDEEVKLEPEENIAERIKLNPRKRKNEEAGLTAWFQTNY